MLQYFIEMNAKNIYIIIYRQQNKNNMVVILRYFRNKYYI